MINQLERYEALLDEAVKTRSERYLKIKSMTISANKADAIMKGIKKLNSEISILQNQVNKIKLSLGYNSSDVLKQEKRNLTIIK